MTLVVVERDFDDPAATAGRPAAEARAALEAASWCMAQYRVKPLRHYLAVDGTRVVCVFDAPDAEAVRNVGRAAGMMPPRRLFAATFHGAPGDDFLRPPELAAAALAVVERSFPEPVAFDDVQAIEDGGDWCFSAHQVRFLRSYFARDGRRMLCLYEAPDAEAVRLANRGAGLPSDRIWAARVIP